MQYASSEDYAKYCPGGTVPPEEQDAALDAASRDIDGLTFDRIVAAGFDRLTAFQQELVKRAVCEQAEFGSVYAELLASPFSSYSINGVAMQFDGAGIVERGGVKLRFAPVCTRRYERLEVDASELESFRLPEGAERNIYRLSVTGETDAPPDLAALRRRYGDAELAPLPDLSEREAHESVLAKLLG